MICGNRSVIRPTGNDGRFLNHRDYTPEEAAEELRKKHLYRQLILSGKLVLPYRSASRLLGPDCLYHLYAARDTGGSVSRKAGSKSGKRKKTLSGRSAEKEGHQ